MIQQNRLTALQPILLEADPICPINDRTVYPPSSAVGSRNLQITKKMAPQGRLKPLPNQGSQRKRTLLVREKCEARSIAQAGRFRNATRNAQSVRRYQSLVC